jgi:selenocysteine-specific elongation factor
MPQTREHLAILDLLDVRRGVVALTKRDLVDDDWLALIEADIVATLRGSTLDGSPVVACSSLTGAGLEELKRALDAAIGDLPPKRNLGRPRLPIDRVFTIAGFGTVVTGTLIDGELALGADVEAQPGGLRGRVRGLQSHRDKVERALPGTRTAVNIAGIAREELRRGLVLTTPGWLRCSDVLDARLRAVERLPHALRHNMHVTFHCGADEANAQLRLLDADELRDGGEAWAQIKLETPVAVVRGDRFVLRTPNDTVAGGVIVDTAPRRHRRRHQPTIDALTALLSDAPEDVLLGAIARTPMAELSALAKLAALRPEQIHAALGSLIASGSVRAFGEAPAARIATAAFADDVLRRAHEALAAYHREHPLRTGMPAEELRSRLRVDPQSLALLLDAAPDLRMSGATAANGSFAPAPSEGQQQLIDAYLAALRAAPESPPTAGIEPELLAYLTDSGAVVDCGNGVVFDAAAFASMRARVRAHIDAHGSITLAQARDLLGTSRRYVQSLLEHLDRLRVTRREGEVRVLR